jgi:GAF domain-containing protein/DNA-binding CsgD family transcriptional regulator
MDFNLSAGDRIVAQIGAELAAIEPDVQAILAAATYGLSRLWPATWVALLMNPDPSTSQVSVADDAEPTMAEYVDGYVASLFGSGRAPTIGLSQQVIESGVPIFIPNEPFANFLKLISPEGQGYVARNPPPVSFDSVSALIVPMRVGGATVGTLGLFDWRQTQFLSEADVAWVQPVADQVALTLEHARHRVAVREQADRVAAIGGIALAARSGQDLRIVLRAIVEQVTARLDVDAADILLVTELGKDLVLAISAGFHSPSVPDYRIPVDGIISDPASSRPHVEYASDPDRMHRQMRRSSFTREGFETFVAVPLYARSRLVGVLEMYSRSVVEWDQAWVDFLDQLGGVVALAIDYAALAGAPDGGSWRAPLREPRPSLSELELAIMRLIIEGMTNRDISAQVHRSENTIKFHVRRILEKTGAANRTELAHRATREGWL